MKEHLYRLNRLYMSRWNGLNRYWRSLLIAMVVCVPIICLLHGSSWIDPFLGIGGLLFTLILSLALGKDDDRSEQERTRQFLEHGTSNTERHIGELQRSTQTQIDAMQRLNQQEIEAMRELFQKQFDILAANTNRQIAEYARETRQVVSKLGENALLLAEILKRQLEEAIAANAEAIQMAKQDLTKAESWQLFRAPDDRQVQVAHRKSVIERLLDARKYLVDKYGLLSRMFLGHL